MVLHKHNKPITSFFIIGLILCAMTWTLTSGFSSLALANNGEPTARALAQTTGSQAQHVTSEQILQSLTTGGWFTTQQGYLKASASGPDSFGYSVAISGNTMVVGAYVEDSDATGVNGNPDNNAAPNSGAVYVFTFNGKLWSQQAYIKASNTEANDLFGATVAISGDTLVVGAPDEDSSATGVDGNQADNSADGSGAAYVFARSNGVWTQQAYLKASNTEAGDEFGYSVAISGDTILIGARHEDSGATGVGGNQSDNSAKDSGAAYVFTRSGVTWSQQAYLKASNTDSLDYFGCSVTASGDTVAVGACGENSIATGVGGNQNDNSAIGAGAVYVYTRSGAAWSQQAYVKASNTDPFDFFGVAVALSGDTLAVGANEENSNAKGIDGNQADNSANDSGAAYVYTRSGATWSHQTYIKAFNTEAGDLFGRSLALDGDILVVGAYQEDSASTGVNGNMANNAANEAGAAYVYTRSNGVWTQGAYLKASNTEVLDYFGRAVGVSGDTVAVGADGEDSGATGVDGNQNNNSVMGSGAAYVFGSTSPNGLCTVDDDGTADYNTIQAAVDDVASCNDIVVNAGWYSENISITRSLQLRGAGSENTTVDGGGWGSTIAISGDYLDITILGMSIVGGHAYQGGGLYFTGHESQTTLHNVDMTGNIASQDGGGIYSGGTITITQSQIRDNIAQSMGGGIYAFGSGVSYITDSEIFGNYSKLLGGGLFLLGSTEIQNTKILTNSADDGGGGIIAGAPGQTSHFPIILTNCEVRGNNSGLQGGGVQADTLLTIDSSEIISNTGGILSVAGTPALGGGIFIGGNGVLTVTNSIVSGNKFDPATTNVNMYGAGIFVSGLGGQLFVEDTTISNNDPSGIADSWDVTPLPSYAVIEIQNSEIVSNTGVGLTGLNALTVIDSRIQNNSSRGISYDGVLTLTGSLVSGNQSGGVFMNDGAVAESVIRNNTGDVKGAGIYVVGNATIEYTTVGDNIGTDQGGGVFVDSAAAVQVDFTTVQGNSSDVRGGGIYANGKLTILSSTISSNTTGIGGGGIYSTNWLSVTNSTISGNSAKKAGGGLLINDGFFAMKDSTIAYNIADSDANDSGDGGGIYIATAATNAGNVTMDSSILAANQDNSPTGNNHPDCSGEFTSSGWSVIGVVETSFCKGASFATNWKGTIGLPLDPKLEPLTDNGGPTWTHALKADSPALDYNWGDCSEFDQRGIIRPKDGNNDGQTYCDAGAFEVGVCQVPIKPILDAAQNGNHLDLSWNKHLVNREVEVWRGPDGVATANFNHIWTNSGLDTTYTDYDVIGNPTLDHFYYAQGQNPCGDFSAVSNMVGELEFPVMA
ncbi:MAG: choice-of-anchor Q domain-containing protein, partial [Anaerolineae bacterium]